MLVILIILMKILFEGDNVDVDNDNEEITSNISY